MLNNIFVQQANRFSSEIKLFETHFYDFFKYHKDNLVGFKSIVKTRNELASALSKKGKFREILSFANVLCSEMNRFK